MGHPSQKSSNFAFGWGTWISSAVRQRSDRIPYHAKGILPVVRYIKIANQDIFR